jgi:TPR repeat protein
VTRLALVLAFALALARAAAAQNAAAPSTASPVIPALGAGVPGVGVAAQTPAATASALPPRADGKPPDFAFGAYQRGNFLFALKEAERRLDDNPKDAAAMTLIGAIYHDGAAVSRSDLESSRWYRLASNLGDPQAAYELGVLLLEGADGVPKDRDAAKEQFERAAAKNQPAALYNLGVIALDASDGRKPDFAKAAQLFLRAAYAGDDDGAYSYGVMLREGKGVPPDIVESAHWLKRAADAGVVAGQVEYAIMLFNGEGATKDEAGAVKLLKIAAAKGNPIAQNRIAHLYAVGRVVERDMAKAAAWNSFAKAAGLADQSLDVATANLTPDERKRFTRIVRDQIGY